MLNMALRIVILATALTMVACGQHNSLDFGGVDPALTVPPTQVMVLGTAHLHAYKDDLSLDDLEPLLERLESYAPDIITIENSPGMTCQRAKSYPREHVGYADYYCFDGKPYRAESGLSLAQGSFLAREALLDWPDTPTAAQRRQLAAYFLASEEPISALVQWLRLDEVDRITGDGVGPASAKSLNRLSLSMNESASIAARLAARQGLERVFYADDHGSFLDAEGESEAYGARLNELWQQGGDLCQSRSDRANTNLTGGNLLGAYREYNSQAYSTKAVDCDFRLTMNDDELGQYGRKYTIAWQARNLRMVSLIMDAAATKPGGRLLSIVGTAHKPFQEAYLDQMHDIEVVSTDQILQ